MAGAGRVFDTAEKIFHSGIHDRSQERCKLAVVLFDAAKAQDPNMDDSRPKALRYAWRMTGMIGRFLAEAGKVVPPARRDQHSRRWKCRAALTARRNATEQKGFLAYRQPDWLLAWNLISR